MENLAESFSNYPACQYHFGNLIVEKVGKDDYVARGEKDSSEFWFQRGSREYINGWMYRAVQAVCGQIPEKHDGLRLGNQRGQ